MLQSRAMHFAWCLVLMFGVPARGLREAAEAFEARDNSSLMDHCCCRDARQGMLTVRDCAAYKKDPEKPYWWHEGKEGSVDRCCWIEGGLGCSGKSTKASGNYCDGSRGNVHLDTSVKQRGRDNGDVCCCKHQVERKDALSDKSETVVMEHRDCQMLKQIRADRPFWWHAAEPDGHLCCWTSGHNCVHTTGVLFTLHHDNGGDRISDDSDRARLCPDAKWAQEVEPHDKTLAWNFASIELEREMHNALAKAIFNTVLGGAAAGSGVEHLQALDTANGMTAPVGFGKAAGGPDQKRVPMSSTAPVVTRRSDHRGPGKGTWVIAKAAGRLFRVPNDSTNCSRSDDPYLHVSAAPGTDEYLIACAMLREDIKRDYEWFELHSFAEGGNVIRDPGCPRDYLLPEFRHGFRIGAEKGTDDYREACQMLRGIVPLKAEWKHDEWDSTSGKYLWVIRRPLP